jgi:hypothetical protein
MSSSSEKPNKNTYIGYVKMKKGGMKIIPGDKDNKIISVRNKILGHLNKVFSGGKRLKEKNIKKYFKALGGKYIRNNICSSGNNSNCKGGRNISINGAHKLLKLISKKNLPINSALETFKGSAPELYKKLEHKLSGGFFFSNNNDNDNDDGNNKTSYFDMAKKYASYAKNKLSKITDNVSNYARDNYNYAKDKLENMKYDETSNYVNDKLNKLKNYANDNYNYAKDKLENMKYDETSNYVMDKLNDYGTYAKNKINEYGSYDMDNMYGGNNTLNDFRNEIGRFNLNSLRQEIINIDL